MDAKILIVDDHEVVRNGIRATLNRLRPNWEICGEATNGKDAILAIKTLAPDVAVLDISMPVMNGLEASSLLSKLSLPTKILIFTMHESDRIAGEVKQVGAHGYVQKSQASRDLVLAIETLLAGGTFFGPQAAHEGEKKNQRGPGLSFFHALAFVWNDLQLNAFPPPQPSK